MKSKTKISKQSLKKSNPILVETIKVAKKHEPWMKVASILSGPRKNFMNINLQEIDEKSNVGEIIVLPGKVLSQGEITKKINLVALSFSETAKEKLSKSKIGFTTIINEIKKNPDGKKIRILTGKEK